MSVTTSQVSNNPSMDDLVQKYRLARAIKNKELGISEQEIEGKGRAIGYTRVSTTLQADDGKSMESQATAIENYCRSVGLILDGIVDEPAKSGADRNRPKLQHLINTIKHGAKLVCYSVDRICRDTKYLLDIKDILHLKGCSIYFIDRHLDTADRNTEMLLTISAAVAEENRKAQNRTISAVMQDMSKKGTLVTRPKYGWKVVKHELIPDEDEQVVIQIIGKMIKDDPNVTLSHIVKQLTALNIKIRKSAQIYPTTIKNIIANNNLR